MRFSKKKKFGAAFKDELAKVSNKSGHFKQKANSVSWVEGLIAGAENEEIQDGSIWRKFAFVILTVVVFLILSLRLFHLQIVEGKFSREVADSNRIQIRIIHAPRGVIYDRNERILAQNEPGFRLVEEQNKKSHFITRDQALNLEVKNDSNYKNLEVDNLRSYPLGKSIAHVVGYVGEITEEELKDPKFKNYRVGDKIGRSGVEQIYESTLKGKDGGEVIEVDAQGKKITTLRQTPPIPGQNLYITIDSTLQEQLYKQIESSSLTNKSCCGVGIAQDPSTAEILALASYPSFDPVKIDESLSELNSPFLNRAIAGTYPPGSIFKIISSVAALSSGKITSSTEFEDTGILNLGPYSFANWYFSEYGRKEGMVNIVKALQRSNDIYFYHIGEVVGENYLGDIAKKFGLGNTVGIDLPGEERGLIPNGDWKLKNVGVTWYPGDTLHMAIGQGYVLTTPLQLNVLTAEIAENGNFFTPHIALKITSPEGNLIKTFDPQPKKISNLNQDQVDIIKQGLALVPQNGGTAWPFFTFPIKTAGKTGTAEFGNEKKTHAWYTAYAPVDDPKIVMTVLIEGGGEGSTVASPIVKESFRYFFSSDKKNLIKDISPIATESAKTLGE